MSLINDALKKAQRQRTEQALADTPMPGGGAARRVLPRGPQSLFLLAAGGALLVVLSAVGTLLFINHSPEPRSPASGPPVAKAGGGAAKPPNHSPVIKVPLSQPGSSPAKSDSVAPAPASSATAANAPAAPPATTPAPVAAPARAPVVVAPPAERPLVRADPSTSPENRPATPPELRAPPPLSTLAPAPVPAAAPSPAEKLAAAPPAPKADERVHAFIDAIRVSGIRSSGEESRVIMNDRMYRVNDIVERTLGLRLTSVASDCLTFTDPNGVHYVKNF